MALGTNTPFIVLNSGLVDLLDAEELRRSSGTTRARAVRALGVPDHLYNSDHAGQRSPSADRLPRTRAIIWGLEEWYRKSSCPATGPGCWRQDVEASGGCC